MWVGVDTQAPSVRITSAVYGTGADAGHLAIQWEANDPKLKPEPINLYFSDHAEGPWTVIAAGLPNNQRYHWRVDHRLPRQIYLRIEARDEAVIQLCGHAMLVVQRDDSASSGDKASNANKAPGA